MAFQYISCYSLSIHLPVSKLCYQCFNTSHVTLYHGEELTGEPYNKFQYISCYSLSMFSLSLSISLIKFQYISCYSLSISGTEPWNHQFVSIHLMLLFIARGFKGRNSKVLFQYISCYSLSISVCAFIFLLWMFQYISCYSLSTETGVRKTDNVVFQYISCYSLSGIRV